MIDFLRVLRVRGGYRRRLLGLVPALVLAEIFYRFHSFTLEFVAFLATWFVVDLLAQWIVRFARSQGSRNDSGFDRGFTLRESESTIDA